MRRDDAPQAQPRLVNIAADIPPSLVAADEALTRYGRWATGRRGGVGRCGSAESMFRGDTASTAEQRRVPALIGMTVQEALTCQRALARVPDVERIVLAILYVPQRLPPEAQLRMLGISPRLSRDRHLRGLRIFNNLLHIMRPT